MDTTTDKQPAKILIVDDEPEIVQLLQYNLHREGYVTAAAADGAEAVRAAKTFLPDLILMDVMMPGKDGLAAMREIRQMPAMAQVAIILLTARIGDQHEIEGLEKGADDYIAKPIKPQLLATRISAALRRTRKDSDDEDDKQSFGDFEINRSRFTVAHQDREILLAKKEFELLALLASKPGRVFLRHEILQRVWGTEVIVGDRTIDVHVRKIRQKTGIDLITTVKGVGYKFALA